MPDAPDASELFDAIAARDPEHVRELLAEQPALARARDRQGLPAILVARYRYELDILDALVAAASELDVHEATVTGDAARVRALVEADPTSRERYTADGFTPLHLAAYFSEPQVTAALVELGAAVDAWTTGEVGMQALHLAATRPRNGRVVRLLAAAGADVNTQQDGGYTALHRAAQLGDLDTVQALLDSAADPALRADDGLTPAETAVACDHDAVAGVIGG